MRCVVTVFVQSLFWTASVEPSSPVENDVREPDWPRSREGSDRVVLVPWYQSGGTWHKILAKASGKAPFCLHTCLIFSWGSL